MLCERAFHHEQVNARLHHVRIAESSTLIMASYAHKLSYVNWMEFPKEKRTGELGRISAGLVLNQCPSGLNRH